MTNAQAFKWEVKQVSPLVRGLTGTSSHGADMPRSGGVDTTAAATETADRSMTTSTTAESTAGEDELPEPGTTRHLLAKFQSLQTTTTTQ